MTALRDRIRGRPLHRRMDNLTSVAQPQEEFWLVWSRQIVREQCALQNVLVFDGSPKILESVYHTLHS